MHFAIPVPVVALLVSVAIVWVANGLCFTLLALRMSATGFGPSDVGLIAAAYFSGQFVGALVCGRIIEQVGHVRAFAAFASVVSAVAIAHALHVDVFTWSMLRALHGFCIAGALMVTESWLNGSVANRGRGRLLAIYTIIQFTATSAGQLLLNLDTPTGFALFTVASILFSLAILPLLLSPSVQASTVSCSVLRFRTLFRISPLGVAGCCAGGALVATTLGMMPVYLSARDLGVSDIALFMSTIIFGGLLVQYPVGKASDRFDRRRVITAALFAGAALSLIIVVLSPLDLWLLAMLTTLYSGIIFAIYPLAVSHANDFLDPVDLVAASGGLIMAMAAGAAVGPLATSALMEYAGADGFYIGNALICLLIGGFAAWRMTRRTAPPLDEQGPYVLVSRTTPLSAALDPRADHVVDTMHHERGQDHDVQTASAP